VPVIASPTALLGHARRLSAAVLALALAACASGGAAPASRTAPPAATKAADTIYLGTAGVTGVYYPAGGAICRMVNKSRSQHGMTCAMESTEGSIANLEALRAGEIDLALVQSDWQFQAYEGDGPFAAAGPDRDLRAVLSLHPEPFTVVARADSGIARVADLKGKRVNIGNPGSGQRATTEALMAATGWTMADFAQASELPAEEQAAALAAGRVDAIIFTVGHPSGEIYDATKSTAARIVPITGPTVDRLLADHPYFAQATIPGGIYRGNDRPTPTFGVRATLVTTAGTPDEVVYLVVKSVFENIDEFRSLHPALAQLDRREMARAALTAPLHPGAERYYREAGLL
jgi:TRAP transporter TAXI family solute receptor